MNRTAYVVLVALVLVGVSSSAATATSQEDLTVIGTTARAGSSLNLALTTGGSGIAFQNVTWYIYAAEPMEVQVVLDGNVTETIHVDGMAIYRAQYDEGRHTVTFQNGTMAERFTLNVRSALTEADWYELTGQRGTADPGNPDFGVWAVTLVFFLIPVWPVYRIIRKRKRKEVEPLV